MKSWIKTRPAVQTLQILSKDLQICYDVQERVDCAGDTAYARDSSVLTKLLSVSNVTEYM